MKKQFVHIKWICKTIPAVRALIIKKILLGIISSFIDLFHILIMGWIIQAVFAENDFKSFAIYIVLFLLLFGMDIVVKKVNLRFVNGIEFQVLAILRKCIYDRIVHADANDLIKLKSGEVWQIFGQDIEDIYTTINDSIEKIVISIAQIIIASCIVSSYSVLLSLVIIILSISSVKLTSHMDKNYQSARLVFRNKHGEYIDWINEHLKGMKDIRTNQAEEMAADYFKEKTHENLKEKEKIRFVEIRAERIIGLVTSIIVVLFWAVSALMIFSGTLTVGIFYVINKYFDKIMLNISTIEQEKINIKNCSPGFDKVRQILFLHEEEESGKEFQKKGKGDRLYKLDFNNIQFSYGSRAVLKNLNLSLETGKMYVIVGANGEGKTTLMNLILRFFRPIDGSIKLNGVGIEEYSLESWRKHIGFMQQNNIIFDGTLYDNVKLYAPQTDEKQVWKALTSAGLYDTVKEWEKGIYTDLQRGEVLSEGQKQRVAIARIMAKDPEIVLLDEPTAMLDHDIEESIVSDIKKMSHNKILIIVTHRIAVARQADVVFLMKSGRILEYGRHVELVKRSDVYRKLFGLKDTCLESGGCR